MSNGVMPAATLRSTKRRRAALSRRDPQQLLAAALTEYARGSLVLDFSLSQRSGKGRLLAERLQPGIAGKRREAETAAGDDALEEIGGGIELIQMGEMPG